MPAFPVANDILVTSITATTTPTLLYNLLSAGVKTAIGGRKILSITTYPAAEIGWITETGDTTGFPGPATTVMELQSQNIADRLKVKAVSGTVVVKLILSLS